MKSKYKFFFFTQWYFIIKAQNITKVSFEPKDEYKTFLALEGGLPIYSEFTKKERESLWKFCRYSRLIELKIKEQSIIYSDDPSEEIRSWSIKDEVDMINTYDEF